MRKITQEAVKAFYNGEKYNKDNTMVENGHLYLHGNLIASMYNGQLKISHCGYKTKTTKERLNGILQEYGIYIKQKNYIWYLVEGEETKEMKRGETIFGIHIY